MKILFLTDSNPFPPTDGVKLPIAKLAEYLSTEHEVDFVICNTDNKADRAKQDDIPDGIGDIKHIRLRRASFSIAIASEILLARPVFINMTCERSELQDLFKNKVYDWVWVSPLSALAIVDQAKLEGVHFFTHLAIGLNDVLTAEFMDSGHKFKKRRTKEFYLLFRMLRQWPIKRFERKLMQQADLIHVQSKVEVEKARKIFGKDFEENEYKFAPVANGVDTDFLALKHNGEHSNKILFVTPLSGARKLESHWFLKYVWPSIKNSTDLILVLVGRPPELPMTLLKDARIQIAGRVSDLGRSYQEATIGILPIFHRSGLINRLQDGMSVGLPMVCTQEVASTIPDLVNGRHVMIAKDAEDFASCVIQLYKEIETRKLLSRHAKSFMEKRSTWNEYGHRIESRLKQRSA